MPTPTFAPSYRGASIAPRPDIRVRTPGLRAIEILKPARGSHHQPGDVLLQPEGEEGA